MSGMLAFESKTGTVLVEVAEATRRPTDLVGKVASAGDVEPSSVVARAANGFEAALDVVQRSAQAFVEQVEKMARKPSSLEVEFGLKASGEMGIFAITKASGEANFKVKLKWTLGNTASPGEPGQVEPNG